MILSFIFLCPLAPQRGVWVFLVGVGWGDDIFQSFALEWLSVLRRRWSEHCLSVLNLEKLSQHVTEVLTLRRILDQLVLNCGRLIFFRVVSNLINRNNSAVSSLAFRKCLYCASSLDITNWESLMWKYENFNEGFQDGSPHYHFKFHLKALVHKLAQMTVSCVD